MFKRLLKVFAFVVGFCIFPIVFLYQFVEFVIVVPLYWIITGNKYTDVYDIMTFVWIDIMSGDRTLKDFTFKKRFK